VRTTPSQTPSVPGDGNGQPQGGISDPYKRANTWNTPLGQLYGPVQVAPSSYGFMSK
jgi:hypothetical protein